MDNNKVISICILVVNEDLTCNNIVKEMLRLCNHQVLRIGGALDVFHAIWEKKDGLDLFLTNADKLESDGPEIFKHIHETLRLPVISISLDNRKIESKGRPFRFSAYVTNDLSIDGVNKLWEMALERERGKLVAAHEEENVQRVLVSNTAIETNKASSSNNDAACLTEKGKGVELSEGRKEDHHIAKKPRVVWTIEMHQKFLEAIEIIGYESAVPKKIVEVMNIPGLTRENVASHLQKYRGSMKRTQETVFSPFKPHYLNTCMQFSSREMKNYTNTQGLLFSSQREANKIQQKHVPEFHFTPNCRTYIDQNRDMLLSIDESRFSGNSHMSDANKFVGYRFTSDGKSVECGNSKTSLQGTCHELALLSSNEEDAEKWFAFLDQNTSLQSREACGNDFSVQCPGAFLEGISGQHFSPSPQMLQCVEEAFYQSGEDDVMLKGTGSTSYQFDVEEFDDTIFSQDD